MSRPCYYAGIAWLIACLIGGWLSVNVLLVVTIGSIFCVVLWALVPKFRQHKTVFFTSGAFVSALIVLYAFQFVLYLPMERKVNETVYLEASVQQTEDAVILKVTDGDLPSGVRLVCWSVPDDEDWQPYDRVTGTFTLCQFQEDRLSVLQRKASGVFFAVIPETVTAKPGDVPFWAVFDEWRSRAVACINDYLRADEAALTAGVCFGMDGDLSGEAKTAFQVCGVSHILSVSGFHMTMICQVLMWLFSALHLRRRVANRLTAVCLLLFMAVVGLEAAVVRSGILCVFVLISHSFRRQADSLNSLGAALLLLLVGSPFAAYDVGLLLSFTAAFGLITVCPKLKAVLERCIPDKWREKAPRAVAALTKLSDAICVTLAATATSLPVTALFFGELSTVTVLVNLIVALPLTVVLIVGLFGCLFSWLLGAPTFLICGIICRIVLKIIKKIAEFPLVTVAIRDSYLLLWVVGTIGLLWIGYRFAKGRGMRIGAVASAIILCMSVCLHTVAKDGVSEITVFPTDGDTAVCLTHEEQTVLITAPSEPNTLYVIRAQLSLLGVDRVDTLILLGGTASLAPPMKLLLGDALTNAQVLYGNAAEKWATFFEGAVALTDKAQSPVTDLSVCQYDTFTAVQMRGTRLVVCNGTQSVYDLPKTYRAANAVVFSNGIAQDAMLFEQAVAVVQGSGYTFSNETWLNMKRIVAATETNEVRLRTRGFGDIK